MNKLTILLALFLVIPCRSRHEPAILHAESERFYSGRKETPGGVRYIIRMVVYDSSDNLSLERLWTNGKALPLFMASEETTERRFFPNDTIELIATRIVNETITAPPEEMPEHEKLKATFTRGYWIEYLYKNRRKFIEIKVFLEKDPGFYD